MPERETVERAREDAREGKSPSTQAGEFVREEIHHIREGKHGAASTKQAIAIGLSKARRAGVKLAKGSASTQKKAEQDSRASQSRREPSRTRSRATSNALKREPRSAASRSSLSRQAQSSALSRGKRARSVAAKKAAQTRTRRAA